MAKVLVTIEDPLLRRIDRTARDRGLTRSAYLSELARDDLDRQRGPGADPEVRAAIARLRSLAGDPVATTEDATALVRRMRDERGERFR
jgi:DNA-binding phage protein